MILASRLPRCNTFWFRCGRPSPLLFGLIDLGTLRNGSSRRGLIERPCRCRLGCPAPDVLECLVSRTSFVACACVVLVLCVRALGVGQLASWVPVLRVDLGGEPGGRPKRVMDALCGMTLLLGSTGRRRRKRGSRWPGRRAWLRAVRCSAAAIGHAVACPHLVRDAPGLGVDCAVFRGVPRLWTEIHVSLLPSAAAALAVAAAIGQCLLAAGVVIQVVAAASPLEGIAGLGRWAALVSASSSMEQH